MSRGTAVSSTSGRGRHVSGFSFRGEEGEFLMQLKHIALTALVIGGVATSAGAAGNNKKPVTQWTCADFLAVEDQFKPKVVYSATAYSKAGKPEAAVIDIEGTEKVTPMIISECQKAPRASFWDTLKAEWHKLEAKVK
jgi:acid stress chaperone HdeA